MLDATDPREAFRLGLRSLLPRRPDSTGAESGRIESGHDIGPILERTDASVESESVLAPSGRNDALLDGGTLRAREGGRLVGLVDEPDRDQHHPGAEIRFRPQQPVQVSELQRHFSA